MNKRGLSPVIATVLLVAISLVLAAIIFFWAKGFLEEQTQKRGEPIENSCDDVVFDAQAKIVDADTLIEIVNRGNVPIAKIQVRKEVGGSIENVEENGVTDFGFGSGIDGINIGKTDSVIINSNLAGSSLIITPMLLGERGEEQSIVACENEFSQKIEVSS